MVAAPDQVRSGELALSNDEAFGIRLPRALRVGRREPDLIVAEGSIPIDEALAYLRAETTFTEEVEEVAGVTSFKRVQPKAPASDWHGMIRVDASGTPTFTSLRIFGEAHPRQRTGSR